MCMVSLKNASQVRIVPPKSDQSEDLFTAGCDSDGARDAPGQPRDSGCLLPFGRAIAGGEVQLFVDVYEVDGRSAPGRTYCGGLITLSRTYR